MTGFISNLSARAAVDAIVDRLDLGSGTAQGRLKIYSGTVPTDADTALGAQVLLVTLNFSNPAFGAAADIAPGARATANAIADGTAVADGTASFFRATDRDAVAVLQGAAGTGAQELVFTGTASIVTGATVQCTSFTVTLPES